MTTSRHGRRARHRRHKARTKYRRQWRIDVQAALKLLEPVLRRLAAYDRGEVIT